MSDLQYYLVSADAHNQPRLKEQCLDAANKGTITCSCGLKRALVMAYKCLYCGEWFCFTCAEIHFGKPVHKWREDKRKKLRKELSTLSPEQIYERIKKRARNNPDPLTSTPQPKPQSGRYNRRRGRRQRI